MRKEISLVIIILIILSFTFVTGCTSSDEKLILGTWVEVDDPSNVVKITKEGDKFYWEEKYFLFPAYFKDGVLTINTGIGDFSAIYDEESDNIIVQFETFDYRLKRQ